MKSDPTDPPNGQTHAEAVLAAVSFATDRLLRSPSWRDEIDTILKRLGEAAGISRAALIQRVDEDEHEVYIALHSVWKLPELGFEISEDLHPRMPMRGMGIGRWIDLLERGETIMGHAHQFAPSERAMLNSTNIASLLVIPVTVNGRWWGQLSFDDSRTEREWSPATVAALATLGNMLGAVIERSLNEHALRDSERQYQAMIENLPVGFQRTRPDPDAPMLMANQAAAALYGYDDLDEYLTTRPASRHVNPDDRPAVLDRIIREGGIFNEEQQQRRKDGKSIWISLTARPVFDADGQIDFFDCVLQDITARKEAEQALENERELLGTIIDTIPDAVYLKDTEGRMKLVNKRYVDGMPGDNVKETFIGRTDKEIFGTDRADQWARRDEHILTTGEAVINEEHNYINDLGEPARTVNTIVPFRDNTGQIVGLVGVTRNMNVLMNTERALQGERERLRAVIDTIPDAVYLKDTEGRFLLVNKQFVEGIPGDTAEAEFIGHTDADFFPASWARQWRQRDAEILRTGQAIVNAEHSNVGLEGRHCRTWSTVAPFHDDSGEIVGLVGVVHNVTELMMAERELSAERELLRTIIDTIPDALFVKDIEGKFLLVNSEFVRSWERDDAGEILGKTDYDFFNRTNSDTWRQRDQQIMQTGESALDLEHSYVTDDGTYWLSQNLVPFRDADGHVAGIVGVVRNVTERRRAEQTLRDERSLLRTVIDTIPEAVYLKDVEGRFLIVNRMFIDGSRVECESDALGKTDYDIFGAVHADAWRKRDLEILRTGRTFVEKERETVNLAGHTRWQMEHIAPFYDSGGRPAGLVGVVRNITEAKQVEQALRDEREMFRTCIDLIPESIFLKDAEGRFLVVNEHLVQGMGLTSDEILGHTNFELYSPELAEQWRQNELKILNTGEALVEVETQFVDELGEETWLMNNIARFTDQDGNPAGLVGAIRNVTEAKKAEQALRYERELFRTVIDMVPEAIFLKDLEGRLLVVNEHYAQGVGRPVEEIQGKTEIDLFGPQAEQWQARGLEILRTGRPVIEEEERNVSESGEETYLVQNLAPFTDQEGNPAGLVGAIRDITEAKKAEQALRDERELLRTVFNTIPDVLYIKDTESRFLLVNNVFTEAMGGVRTEADYLGKTDADFFGADVAAQFRQEELTVMQTGERIVGRERPGVDAGGNPHWTWDSIAPYQDSAGRVAGVVGMLRDITDAKDAEQRIRGEEQRLRQVIDTIPDAVYLKDRQGRYQLVNQAFKDTRKMGRWSENDPIGKTDAELSDSDRLPAWRIADESVLSGEASLGTETAGLTNEGEPIWLRVSKAPYRDADNTIVGLVGVISNITEQKLGEQRLQNERRLLRQVIDTIPDVIYMKDRRGRYQLVNRAFTEARGTMPFNDADPIGKTDAELSDSDRLEVWQKSDERVMEGMPLLGRESTAIDSNGQRVWIRVSKAPYLDVEDEIAGLVGVISNVTEQKQAELRTEQERQLLRQVIDTIPEAIYLKDVAGKYLVVNKQFAATRPNPEWTIDDCIGKTDFDMYDQEKAAVYRQLDEEVFDGTPTIEAERSGTKPDGTPLWTSANKAPIHDAEGNIVGLVGAVRNITESKLANQALRDERQMLRTIIDTIPSALYMKNLDGTYVLANRTFCEGFGADTEAEIIGKTDYDLFDAAKAEHCKQADAEMIADGRPVLNREVRITVKDRGEQWHLFNSAPIPNSEGTFIGLIGIVGDITEQKRAEQAIRESEQRFRTLSEQSLLSVIILQDNKFAYANQAFCDLIGYSRDELMAMEEFTYASMLHPDSKAFVMEQAKLKQAGATDVVPHYECRLMTRDGQSRWVELFARTIWQDGKPADFATFVDITARREAEQGMRLKEAQFQEVLNTSRDVAYRLDLKALTYDYVGASSKAMMGYSPEELTEMGFIKAAERFHPDDLQRLDEHFAHLLDGHLEDKISPTIEYRWRCRNGNYRWFSDSRSVVVDEAGQPTAMVGSVRDITDRMEAEEAIRESEAKYRGVIESVPVGMLQIDAHDTGRIIMANPAAAQMFGYDSPDALLGMDPSVLNIPVKTRGMLAQRLLDSGQIVGEEIRSTRADGSELWIAATLNAIRDDSNEVQHFDAVLEDITEKKLAAQAIQEAHSKLLNAREVERRRLATDLHDSLGQSLVVLNLAVQGCYVGQAELTPETTESLKGVADRCTDLIHEVRSICHGLFPPVLDTLGLEAALRGLARDCRSQMDSVLAFPEALTGCRFAEEVEIVLYRIAQEAVHNVIRHSKAENVELSLTYTDGLIRLDITDDGCGFDIAAAGGTGLGLTTLRERAEAVAGTLSIESEPGRTQVTVEVEAGIISRTDTDDDDGGGK